MLVFAPLSLSFFFPSLSPLILQVFLSLPPSFSLFPLLSPCSSAGLSISSSNGEGLQRALVVSASLYTVSLDLRRSSLIGSEVADVIEVIRRYRETREWSNASCRRIWSFPARSRRRLTVSQCDYLVDDRDTAKITWDLQRGVEMNSDSPPPAVGSSSRLQNDL